MDTFAYTRGMKRKKLSPAFENLLKAARKMADLEDARAVVLLAEEAFDFKAIKKMVRGANLLVAATEESIQACVKEDEVDLIALEHEPQTRGTQVSQVLLEAIADEHDTLPNGCRPVAAS